MWPREDEEARTLTELFDIDWRETSFVPAGDNPPARIVMWKNEPLTDTEIEEILADVERSTALPNMAKTQDALAERDRLARQKMAKQDGLTIAQARVEVWLENPDLQERYQQLRIREHEALTSFTGQEPPVLVPASLVEKGATPYAALHKAAREELPDLYRRSPSAAVTEIASSRPDLTAAYASAVRS